MQEVFISKQGWNRRILTLWKNRDVSGGSEERLELMAEPLSAVLYQ